MELRFKKFSNCEFERILKDEMLHFEVPVGHLLATAEQSYQISQPVSNEGCRAGFPTGLGVGPTVGCREQGNEHSVGIKGREMFGQLRDYKIIKGDYALLKY